MRIPDRDTFIDDALMLLREYDLAPEEVDRRAAWIVTYPSTSGQWFELWRHDVHGAYQILESSLHTIRRRVRVEIEPTLEEGTKERRHEGMGNAEPRTGNSEHAPGLYRVSVQVDKERFSSPARQVTTASGALSIYSERIPTKEGLRKGQFVGDHWVPLGRDVLLERHLLGRFAALAPLPGHVAEPEALVPESQP